jgi:hypothetical protein
MANANDIVKNNLQFIVRSRVFSDQLQFESADQFGTKIQKVCLPRRWAATWGQRGCRQVLDAKAECLIAHLQISRAGTWRRSWRNGDRRRFVVGS